MRNADGRHDPHLLPTSLDPPESTQPEQFADPLGANYVGNPFETTFRHSGWVDQRFRIWRSLFRTGQTIERQQAFQDCGTHPWLYRSKSDPNLYRVGVDKCRDRFCTPCGVERSRLIVDNLAKFIGRRTVRFITLTLASTDQPLAYLVNKLMSTFSKLRRRAFWTRNVSGGVAFLEVTRGKNRDRWHPHLHIIATGSYLCQKKLRDLWFELTHDSFVVHVELVRSQQKIAYYVAKYASKPLNSSFARNPDLLDEAVVALKGRKLITSWGTFKDLRATAANDDEHWEPMMSWSEVVARATGGDPWAIDLHTQFRDHSIAECDRAPPTGMMDGDPETPKIEADHHIQSRFDFATSDLLPLPPLDPSQPIVVDR